MLITLFFLALFFLALLIPAAVFFYLPHHYHAVFQFADIYMFTRADYKAPVADLETE